MQLKAIAPALEHVVAEQHDAIQAKQKVRESEDERGVSVHSIEFFHTSDADVTSQYAPVIP